MVLLSRLIPVLILLAWGTQGQATSYADNPQARELIRTKRKPTQPPHLPRPFLESGKDGRQGDSSALSSA